MVLLMCCYLYLKRSNTINVNAEAKEQDANSRRRLWYFYRGIEKRASFPLVLVGAPRKGQAPRWVTSWIALGLPMRKWVSDVPSSKPLLDAPHRLHY